MSYMSDMSDMKALSYINYHASEIIHQTHACLSKTCPGRYAIMSTHEGCTLHVNMQICRLAYMFINLIEHVDHEVYLSTHTQHSCLEQSSSLLHAPKHQDTKLTLNTILKLHTNLCTNNKVAHCMRCFTCTHCTII